MDVSKGRCPNRQKDCECRRVCAALYGQHAQKLRNEVLNEEDRVKREATFKKWQKFVNTYALKI
jgi:hypothetical protein